MYHQQKEEQIRPRRRKPPLISYKTKDATQCPLCNNTFYFERLLSGSGRLITASITPELRHLYKPNPTFGPIYPLIYSIMTCPECWYSAFPGDFLKLKKEEITTLQRAQGGRKQKLHHIFGPLSFHEKRGLALGMASYLLALDSYQKRGSYIAPTPKKALCSLRAAWLSSDLDFIMPARIFRDSRRSYIPRPFVTIFQL